MDLESRHCHFKTITEEEKMVHGLESNHESSLKSEEEAGIP